MTLVNDLAQHLPPSGRYETVEEFLEAMPGSDKVKAVAADIISNGLVSQAIDAITAIQTGRAVNPVTGEVTTRGATAEKSERGQLPDSLLDSFRQYYGAGSKHQWEIGRVVDDAIAEYAGKLTANQILKAAVKEMDKSKSFVQKCRDTWAATDESLRAEYDMLTFEHFAVLRFVGDQAKVRAYLQLCLETADSYGGRPMPAKKLEARVREDLGLAPPPPTPAERLDRAIRAVENYQAVAEGRAHAQATAALDGLRKINQA